MRAQIGSTVSGVVTDPSGASVPGAKLEFRNVATRIARQLSTNANGFFAAPNLSPGMYAIAVSAAGFQTQTVEVTVATDAEQQMNFALRVGPVNERVQVTAPPPGIELATSAVGAVVSGATIVALPLNGRSWTDLAALQPGVAPIEAQPSYAGGNSRGNRGFGAQLAISGARPQQNNYRVDGISINDYSNGGPGSVLGGNLGVDAVQEFSLLTDNYPAAYGRASGGVISASTRSGSNALHGSAYEFIRNSAVDARNFFDKAGPPPFRRNQFGGSAGGPVAKEKTFVFVDYEGIRQSTGATSVATVPSSAARQGILSTGDIPVDPAVARYLAFFRFPTRASWVAPTPAYSPLWGSR